MARGAAVPPSRYPPFDYSTGGENGLSEDPPEKTTIWMGIAVCGQLCNSYADLGHGTGFDRATIPFDSRTYKVGNSGHGRCERAERSGGHFMRQMTIPVALALALAVSASEASPKGPASGKPTVTKVQTQKGGATKPSTVKASTSKGSTSKGSTPKGTSPSGSKSVKSTQTSPKLASGAQTKGSESKSLKSAKSDTTIAKTDKAVKAQ